MKTVTTKAIAKVAAVATGLAMATSMLSLAPYAHAASLTASQVSSILSLLSSFGAGADTIANVNSALTGAPMTTTTTTTTGSSYTFTRDLTVGSKGADVTALQNALIAKGFSIAAGATGYFGAQTVAAVKAWQTSAGVTPAAGYFGAKSRAAFGSVATTGGTTTTTGGTVTAGTGNGLKVMLAADSPNNVALVQGQAIGTIAKFTFANPTGAEVKVTNVAFKRIGVSSDSTLSAVYLYNGVSRITDSASLSSGSFSFTNNSGIFTVPAGQTVTVSVRANIAGSTSGEQVGVQLTAVTSTGTLDSSVALPVNGYTQTISSASIGTVAITYTGPSNATDNPATDVRVFEGSTVVSTHAASLSALTFEQRGTSKDGDLKNFRLYVDGNLVGSTVTQAVNDRITFDLSANPLKLETGTRIIKVLADIVGGSSYTYDVQIRRAADVLFIDSELNQPILITGTWAAGTANTIASGTLSVTRATNSPSANISVASTNVKLSSFEFRAAGEDIKIETITVDPDTSVHAGGLDNAKVFLNGVQIGSTQDLAEGGTTTFDFGSSLIARAGQTEIVDIYADAKTTTSTNLSNNETIVVGLSIAAADTEGMSSGNTVSAVSMTDGLTRTVSSSSLSASKYSGFGNQTMIAGTNSARLGSFTLSAGSTEGVNVNTIVVNLSTAEDATITDLMLKDNATGAQIGSTKPSPTTDNTFSVNFTVPTSGTKVIDVYANVKSGSNVGPWQATLDSTTGGSGTVTAQSVTIGSDVDLQTITLSSAVLTAALGVSPDDANVIAGSSMVKVGSFDFTSQYSTFTVEKIAVKVSANSATAINAVTLRYPNASGVSTDTSAVLDLSSGVEPYATATFTGLTFTIPQNTTKKLDVYVDLASIQADNESGRSITVILGDDGGFSAKDSAGTETTNLASGDLNSSTTSGKGTMYVRKTVPTLSAVALDTSTLTAGTNKAMARVKVTADAAGDIGWKKMAFVINKTFGITIGATTTVKLWQGSNSIAGTFATTTAGATVGSGTMESFPSTDTAAAKTDLNLVFIPTSEQTVPAGTSLTYELRGTIGGLAANSNSLDVSIANAQTSASTTAAAAVVGIDAETDPSFTWSDKSAVSTVHSTSTSDWTSDYLVKTLPLTIGSLSVSI